MENIVFVNNEYISAKEAKVSIFDRGYLFGDGVYEVVPVINSNLIDKDNFLQRLECSLDAVSIQWPCSPKDYVAMLKELIQRNNLKEGGVYTQVTRGVAPRDFSFPKDCPPSIMAFTIEKNLVNNPLVQTGISVVTIDDIRWKRRDIKSIALLAQCMSKQAAEDKGGFEGWMIEGGYVTEGTSSTAYIAKNGKIITRPLSHSILPGIRRKSLLKMAKKEGIGIEERLFTIAEALEADEAFLSSATTVVLPIVNIDGHMIGDGKPGRLALLLRELYISMALQKTAQT